MPTRTHPRWSATLPHLVALAASLVLGLIATYPLVTMGLSALVLSNVRLTPRLMLGVGLAVAGVVLILAG